MSWAQNGPVVNPTEQPPVFTDPPVNKFPEMGIDPAPATASENKE